MSILSKCSLRTILYQRRDDTFLIEREERAREGRRERGRRERVWDSDCETESGIMWEIEREREGGWESVERERDWRWIKCSGVTLYRSSSGCHVLYLIRLNSVFTSALASKCICLKKERGRGEEESEWESEKGRGRTKKWESKGILTEIT